MNESRFRQRGTGDGHEGRRLRDLVFAQRTLVDRMGELAARQSALIRDGRTDELLAVLSERQSIIDAFTGQAPLLQSLLADAAIDTLDAADRAAVESALEAIRIRIDQVLAVDAEDQSRLDACRRGVRDELDTMGRSRAAAAAYGAAAAGPARPSASPLFTDRRG
ncbi:MAG: hypothetical protein KF817_10305 [Phycisphaeraceae bacterium]|nr:hypothetical protein [Phycisphaeraceae bacterium]